MYLSLVKEPVKQGNSHQFRNITIISNPKAPLCPILKIGFFFFFLNHFKKLLLSKTEGNPVTWGHCSAVNCTSAAWGSSIRTKWLQQLSPINLLTIIDSTILIIFTSSKWHGIAGPRNNGKNRKLCLCPCVFAGTSFDWAAHAASSSESNIFFFIHLYHHLIFLHVSFCLAGVRHVGPTPEPDQGDQERGVRAPGEHGGHWRRRAPDWKAEIQGWFRRRMTWWQAAVRFVTSDKSELGEQVPPRHQQHLLRKKNNRSE